MPPQPHSLLLRILVGAGCAALASAQVTPCFAPSGEVLASDRDVGYQFGSSVAVDGDTLVVGAELADGNGPQTGSVYVFRRVAEAWVQEAELVAADTGFLDYFGASVAIDGDRIVVGASDAPSESPGSVPLAGAGYVFDRSGTTWTEDAKLTPPDPVIQGFFGIAVGVAADVAVVGAWAASSAVGRSGAVYAYERIGGAWLLVEKIVPTDATAEARFGFSLDLQGSDLLVGAPQDSGVCPNDPFCEVGAAYLLEQRPGGWNEVAKLVPPDFADEDHFGIAVRRSQDTIVIGTETSSGVGSLAGSAYVYVRTGSTWSLQQKLEASDAAAGDGFGAGVAVEGDRIVVGAPGDDTIAPEAGSFYWFERSGSGWTELAEVTSSTSEVSTNMGSSACIQGEDLFVTAPKDAHADNVQGSVQLFQALDDPTTYCTAKTSSAGCLPTVGWSGTPGILDADPLVVSAVDVPMAKNGLMFYGLSGAAVLPFVGGTLCAAPPLRRTGIQSSGGSMPDACSGTLTFDLDAWLASGSDPQLTPGVLIHGQFWMRDRLDPFGVGLSNAIALFVCL